MKSKAIFTTVLTILSLLLFGKFCFSSRTSNQQKKNIKNDTLIHVESTPHIDSRHKNAVNKNNFSNVVGVWKSEEDENWQFEFLSNGSCIERSVGSTPDTSSYSISNTSPQCGITVAVDQYTEYIKLTFPADTSKNTCYLLNGTTDSTLSLSPIQSYKILMFKKQQ